eukprot:JP447670.1.p1 GENE.JP447670.1~~JP447670.1.p1  ORF type:complete len:139 (+),score=4.38 JP447670.1:115-531(+)
MTMTDIYQRKPPSLSVSIPTSKSGQHSLPLLKVNIPSSANFASPRAPTTNEPRRPPLRIPPSTAARALLEAPLFSPPPSCASAASPKPNTLLSPCTPFRYSAPPSRPDDAKGFGATNSPMTPMVKNNHIVAAALSRSE